MRSCWGGGSRAGGRTSAFVAGRAASASDLKLLGGRLLAFYGQHEHRKLTISSAQMEILDGFAGADHLSLRESYREAHRECLRLEAELAELRERDGSRERDLDLFRYELSEIEEVAPEPAEEAELAAERERLDHAEGLREAAAGAQAAAIGAEEDGGGAVGALAQAEALLQGVGGVDADLDALAARTRRAGARAWRRRRRAARLPRRVGGRSRPARGGRRAARGARPAAAQARRQRRVGPRPRRALPGRDLAASRTPRSAGPRPRRRWPRPRRAGPSWARSSARARAKAAAPLEREVAAELERLAMPGAQLEVVLEPHPDGFGPGGAETVELLLAPNPGLEPAPLRDAASGGELSRVMLALSGFGGGAGAGTLVFDEIDAGVGGKTARAVGERLRALGEDRQVLCITHLPQVASLAETHFTLEKDVSGDRASASVRRLDGEGVVEEIRRMLGGERSDEAATRHARELLAAA